MESRLEEILLPGEHIIWRDKPDKIKYIFDNKQAILMGSIWTLMSLGIIGSVGTAGTFRAWEGETLGVSVFLAIFLIAGLGLLHSVPKRALGIRKVEYAVTNMRCCISTPEKGKTWYLFDIDEIRNPMIVGTASDRRKRIGDIIITSSDGDSMEYLGIKEPTYIYDVLTGMVKERREKKKVEEVIVKQNVPEDIRTDFYNS